jgi:hypothetical protein
MSDNGHRDDRDLDPPWDLGDLDDDGFDDAGRRRVPLWVIVIAILIALALLIQLAWPLVMDLLDRGGDSGGFPTPGVV